MKTKVASLLVVLVLTATQSMAQKRITVQAQNDDISNNLDLKAVSTAFGESRNLEEFEQKLNDYDSGISNLDLNNDGQVDYLRVIESNEKNVHVVVIQAVLDKDVYQDVASIVVDRDRDNVTTVQVIGDPYIYGDNYIIEPAYVYTPSIFSFFWGPSYFSWRSPYYWGYYPTYYRYRRPFEVNIYLSNVYMHVNHNQRYYYTSYRRNDRYDNIYRSIRRNDYAVRYPDRTFSSRNTNVRNKREFEFSRNGVVRNDYRGFSDGSRSVRSNDNNSSWNSQRSAGQRSYTPSDNNSRSNTYQSRSSNNNNNWQNSGGSRNQYNSGTSTYSAPRNDNNTNVNIQRSNNNYQPRVNSDNNASRSNNNVVRESSRSNSTPQVVSQPRSAAPQRQAESSSRSSESRSSGSSSGSRSASEGSRR